MGRVCEKHNEYCPDGVCRWCEPVEPPWRWATPPVRVVIGSDASTLLKFHWPANIWLPREPTDG